MTLRHSKHAFALKSERKPRRTASRACRGCLTPSLCVIGVLILSLACNDPFALVRGLRYPLCIAFALNCIFLYGFACFSCISLVFLVSRLIRHGGDSLLSFLSFSTSLWLFASVFGVLSRVSFSDHPLIVNLGSSQSVTIAEATRGGSLQWRLRWGH